MAKQKNGDGTPIKTESAIEDYLCHQVSQHGGEVRKVQWLGRRGAPDRLVMLPGGVLVFVELKRPGGLEKFPSDEREEAQQREHKRLQRMGQRVEVIDSTDGVDRLFAPVRAPGVDRLYSRGFFA